MRATQQITKVPFPPALEGEQMRENAETYRKREDDAIKLAADIRWAGQRIRWAHDDPDPVENYKKAVDDLKRAAVVLAALIAELEREIVGESAGDETVGECEAEA